MMWAWPESELSVIGRTWRRTAQGAEPLRRRRADQQVRLKRPRLMMMTMTTMMKRRKMMMMRRMMMTMTSRVFVMQLH